MGADIILILVAALVGLVLGGLGFFVYQKLQDEKKKDTAQKEAQRILGRARSEANKIDRDAKRRAKDFETRARKNVETEIQREKSKLTNTQNQLEKRNKELDELFKQREDDLEKDYQALRDREDKISVAEKRLNDLAEQAEEEIKRLHDRMSAVAGMSQDEAKHELIKGLEDEAKNEAAKRIARIEEQMDEDVDKKAKRILSMALARYAGEYTSERTVSVIALPSDEMKGKIIGREGRNIRSLEAMCGVDLIVDDTPESVVISGFDPVRREVARRALEKLMEDGRVHPARIEEVVEKVRGELVKSIREDGEKACIEVGITGLHPELEKLVGGLKYRSVHAQNSYVCTQEVAVISGLLAAEIGVNPKLAKRAGLLHLVGQSVEHSVEGNYALAGSEMARKFGENEEICQAIRTHRPDDRPNSILGFIVQASHILAISRPGARRPQMDRYIQRLEDLESVGNSFDGVLRTFALQAGKEVRVLVESSRVTDEQSVMLSRDIARKIERELSLPGQVKITVVRESRAVEHAR